MAQDTALPPEFASPPNAVDQAGSHAYISAQWSADHLAALCAQLSDKGREALETLSDDDLLRAWGDAVEAFLDPASEEGRAIRPVLLGTCGLSGPGLEEALRAVLGGVGRSAAAELLRQAATYPRGGGLVGVILASNLPALAVQPLLAALALRRPALLKSPSSEPLFTPAFVNALGRREPALAGSLAALTWKGGDDTLERPLLAAAETLIAYGDAAAIASLQQRAAGLFVPFGPKTSLAVVTGSEDRDKTTSGLANDIALFDQRGCLSVQAIYTSEDPRQLSRALGRELRQVAEKLPPGPLDAVIVSAVQQIRLEARMRGLYQEDLPLETGTIIVEPLPSFKPSPGLRTVRIHPLTEVQALPRILEEWRGRLQGVALAGKRAWSLASALEALGVSRCAPPGRLQYPDASWHNGGIHPLAALTSAQL